MVNIEERLTKELDVYKRQVNMSQDIQCEAIMVSREVSEEMDKAKVITRMFNKSLWEKQYLNYWEK